MNVSLGCFCILLCTQCDPHSAKAFQVDETSVIFTTILSEQIFKHFLEKKIRKACIIQLSQLDFGMTDNCLKVLSSLLSPQAKIGKEGLKFCNLSASRNLTAPKQSMIIRPHINPNWLSNTPIISFQLSAVPAAKNLQNSK